MVEEPSLREGAATVESPDKRLSFLLIYTDQQRADTLGAWGNRAISTPSIDDLCERGVSFTQSYCASPMCSPSRAAFATGRYPRINGCRWNGIPLPRSETTFMELLRDSGYATVLNGKLHLWPHQTRKLTDPSFGYEQSQIGENPRDHPYSAYREWREQHFPGLDDDRRLRTYNEGLQTYVPALPEEAHFSTWVADQTIEFLEAGPTEPFLLTMSFIDPHHPFAPPEPFASQYDPISVPAPRYQSGELMDKAPHFMEVHKGLVDPILGRQANSSTRSRFPAGCVDLSAVTEHDWRQLVALYYGMISMVDAQIGRVMRVLKSRGLAERTVVIFISDHGELLGDHGLLFKGPFHYDSVLRVPMVVCLPGLTEPRESAALVEQIDLTTTILQLAGLPVPNAMQGRSLLPLLEGSEWQGREAVLIERDDRYWDLDMLTLRTERLKLTRYANKPYGELFDLHNDPGEVSNRWDDPAYRSVKSDLLGLLLDRLAETEDPTCVQLAPA